MIMADVISVITADPSGAELVNFAKTTADLLVRNNLTRSQIRNIFTEVRKIEALWDAKPQDALRRLNMLKPKLDYQTSRSSQVEQLRNVLSRAIDEVQKTPNDEERNRRFKRFVELFEAILAYHRALGGKN
jgi:CRISPR-associated protein Csm2